MNEWMNECSNSNKTEQNSVSLRQLIFFKILVFSFLSCYIFYHHDTFANILLPVEVYKLYRSRPHCGLFFSGWLAPIKNCRIEIKIASCRDVGCVSARSAAAAAVRRITLVAPPYQQITRWIMIRQRCTRCEVRDSVHRSIRLIDMPCFCQRQIITRWRPIRK